MRRRGTGSVTQLGDGRWLARMPLRYGRQVVGRFAEEAAARAALAGALAVYADAPDPSVLTVDRWGQQWLDRREASPDYGSARKERSRWGTHIGPSALGGLALEEVDAVEVRAWLDGLRLVDGTLPSYSTRRGCLTLLRSSLRSAVDAGLLAADPCAGVRLPPGAAKGSRDRWEWLRPDEIAAVERAMREAPRGRKGAGVFCAEWSSLITVAMYAGLRAGELHALPWRCVDLEAGRLRVEQTREQPQGSTTPRAIHPTTKSGHAREVPLLPPAVEALREWRAEHERRGLHSRHDLVWPAADGGPRSEGYHAQLPRALELAGVARGVRFHDLRHTCASHLVQGTWSPSWLRTPLRLEEVRQWLGHGSIAMVQRYAHMDPEGLRGRVTRPTGTELVREPSKVAPPRGFEPRTVGLEGRRRGPESSQDPGWSVPLPYQSAMDDAVARFAEAAAAGSPHTLARAYDMVRAWHDLRAEMAAEEAGEREHG